ncbi:hypothetical protein PIIN_00253 [Serendipita indica DSM 11827]|uniref:Uncharacterized protein n=1 Tax=Serendipita indica (strain DSM 11827) TaxID=1109443 RepID=G4T5K7_SERID|nr:hypothetical protein PIIN_00253 [Serendipita indica DSM 11827]
MAANRPTFGSQGSSKRRNTKPAEEPTSYFGQEPPDCRSEVGGPLVQAGLDGIIGRVFSRVVVPLELRVWARSIFNASSRHHPGPQTIQGSDKRNEDLSELLTVDIMYDDPAIASPCPARPRVPNQSTSPSKPPPLVYTSARTAILTVELDIRTAEGWHRNRLGASVKSSRLTPELISRAADATHLPLSSQRPKPNCDRSGSFRRMALLKRDPTCPFHAI